MAPSALHLCLLMLPFLGLSWVTSRHTKQHTYAAFNADSAEALKEAGTCCDAVKDYSVAG